MNSTNLIRHIYLKILKEFMSRNYHFVCFITIHSQIIKQYYAYRKKL